MKILFSGVWDFPDEEAPDDRGSIDNWLIKEIEAAIREGPELDDIYDRLKLQWKTDKEE